jgi:GDSL-like lipase/acylhydrolase family protein
VALGLALTECVVRAWMVVAVPTMFMLDDELGWVHRPGVRHVEVSEGVQALIEINALGLRGPVHDGPTSARRVLILGDSFAEGPQVTNEELFSVIWEREHPELEIVNAGVMGYGTVQEAIVLRHLAPRLRPDVVVLIVSANDPHDNVTPFVPSLGPRPYADSDGEFQVLQWRPYLPFLPPVPGSVWLYRNSIVFQLWQTRRAVRLIHTQLLNAYRDHWWVGVPEAVKWKVLERWVGIIAQNQRLVLVSCPTREAVIAGRTAFSDHLAEIARRVGIPFVDLQPVLRADDFFVIHWNAAGHRVVAHTLASEVGGLLEGRGVAESGAHR